MSLYSDLKRSCRWASIGVGVLYTLALTSSTARAFTVSPGRVEITIPAGESRRGSFTVGNPGDTLVRVKVTAEDWSSAQDERTVVKGEASSLSWLEFAPQELELGPRQSEVVNYTVTLPEEAKGEYAAMVYFGTVPEPSEKGVSIVSRIGNALYVIVEGTEIVKGQVSNIIIARIDPLQIDITVRNEGNIHIRPRGEIIIEKVGPSLSKRDRELIKAPFNKEGFPIFPQRKDIFATKSEERLNPGRYRLEFTMEFDHEIVQKEFTFTVTEKGEAIKFGAEN